MSETNGAVLDDAPVASDVDPVKAPKSGKASKGKDAPPKPDKAIKPAKSPKGSKVVPYHESRANESAILIDPRRIHPDPEQPRKEFDPVAMAELIASVRAHGVLQPIRVKRIANADGLETYQVVAGERRWRAASAAKIDLMPVIVVRDDMSPAEVLEEQLIENIIRDDLNPMERAQTFKRLMGVNKWTLTKLAERVGMDKAIVSRSLALLNLPSDIQASVEAGNLPPATAYEISRLKHEEEQRALAARVVSEDLSRSEVQDIVRDATPVDERRPKRTGPKAPEVTEGSSDDVQDDDTQSGPGEVSAPVLIAPRPVSTPPVKFKVLDGNATIHVVWNGEAGTTVIRALEAALKLAKGK